MSQLDPQNPQPKRRWFVRHKFLTAIGGVFALAIVFSIATGSDDSAGTRSDTAATAPQKQADAEPAGEADNKQAEPAQDEKLSQAEKFKAFINENGTDAEKAAGTHITKVQGSENSNGILDTAEVYTDYTGGMMGPHQGDGKLIASAFADWRDSDNGLVSVYDESGQLLSNGNY